MSNDEPDSGDPTASELFDQFLNASSCESILSTCHDLTTYLKLQDVPSRQFYRTIRQCLTSRRAQSLWTELDKRAEHQDYKKQEACADLKALVIGSGPCGLRAAIELALLGCHVVLVEKRDRFSRNNVLHLWPFVITDLRNLGAKKFFGKFCSGAIDHISIRQLQCILLKVALLFGVEVHVNVSFEEILEPPEDQSVRTGWRARVSPPDHPVSEFQFDVVIGAGGKKNKLPGFKRIEFRASLAIAITANFVIQTAEAHVEEIAGKALIYDRKFFKDLKERTGIDLENIVYYKDDTHYFVMTAKKQSLLEKGVLKEDQTDTAKLLARENVNHDELLAYAREAADFSTSQQLPQLEYAVNHYGQADVAMFDFTSMFAAENASRIMEKRGFTLVMGIVGDYLLEPFWPMGTGCARGFLGALDAAWMVRSFASGHMSALEVLQERESIYQLLSQTTPEKLHKDHNAFSIDPNTRYPNLNSKALKQEQVKHLYTRDGEEVEVEEDVPAKRARSEGAVDSRSLLRWCQRTLNTGRYGGFNIVDFTTSWRNGMALCSLIHAFRPSLINVNALKETDIAINNQLAFDVAERELGIPPMLSSDDLVAGPPDKLTMVDYLAQFHQLLHHEQPAGCVSPIPPSPVTSGLTLQDLLDRETRMDSLKADNTPCPSSLDEEEAPPTQQPRDRKDGAPTRSESPPPGSEESPPSPSMQGLPMAERVLNWNQVAGGEAPTSRPAGPGSGAKEAVLMTADGVSEEEKPEAAVSRAGKGVAGAVEEEEEGAPPRMSGPGGPGLPGPEQKSQRELRRSPASPLQSGMAEHLGPDPRDGKSMDETGEKDEFEVMLRNRKNGTSAPATLGVNPRVPEERVSPSGPGLRGSPQGGVKGIQREASGEGRLQLPSGNRNVLSGARGVSSPLNASTRPLSRSSKHQRVTVPHPRPGERIRGEGRLRREAPTAASEEFQELGRLVRALVICLILAAVLHACIGGEFLHSSVILFLLFLGAVCTLWKRWTE